MIRLGRESDLDSLEALLPSILAPMLAAGNDQWGSEYPRRDDFADDCRHEWLYVDADDSGLRGVVVLNEVEPPEYRNLPWSTRSPSLVLHRLAVNPAFQGQGIATGLFAFAETRARERGYQGLRSDTSDANAGMNHLFFRRGWSQVGSLRFPHATVGFVAWEKALHP